MEESKQRFEPVTISQETFEAILETLDQYFYDLMAMAGVAATTDDESKSDELDRAAYRINDLRNRAIEEARPEDE